MEESNKFKYLNIAKNKGINVPDLIYINFENYNQDTVKLFLKKSSSKYFIIRSAIQVEDSISKSYAGHFYSSSKISKENILKELLTVKNKNEELITEYNLDLKVTLFIQEFIDSKIGGISFFPWKYYSKHFLTNISTSGIQNCVNGVDSTSYLISIDKLFKISKYEDSLNLIDEFIKEKLISLILKLKEIFSFKFDIEWIYYNKQIYLVQIRPVTIEPSSILNENENIKKYNITQLNKNSTQLEMNWQFTQFSENLGILSPLSFSLIQKLFNESNTYLQEINFKALNSNYLHRLTNGQVLVNVDKYNSNFNNCSIFSAFLRGLNNYKQLNLINEFIENYLKSQKSKFNYNLIVKIFGYWQQSIIYSYGFKEKFNSNYYSHNEYELTNIFPLPTPSFKYLKNWNLVKNLLKLLFLFELNKLKIELQKSNFDFQFLEFDYYLQIRHNSSHFSSSLNTSKIRENYIKDLELGVFDIEFFLENSNQKVKSSLNSKKIKSIKGEVIVIKNSNLNLEQLHITLIPKSEKKILISKYFKNEWISQIENFKAIILELGGELSHSAIVAREKNIPYVIQQKDITSKFKTGDLIYYNSKTSSFEKK
ncbi:MAG: hypothetical protein LAT82_00895 [Nanoarchaeota archaeon]|nr:hypothetical protein [Nanoarchaeota archaeon]